jgi:hypothetical protein
LDAQRQAPPVSPAQPAALAKRRAFVAIKFLRGDRNGAPKNNNPKTEKT